MFNVHLINSHSVYARSPILGYMCKKHVKWLADTIYECGFVGDTLSSAVVPGDWRSFSFTIHRPKPISLPKCWVPRTCEVLAGEDDTCACTIHTAPRSYQQQ